MISILLSLYLKTVNTYEQNYENSSNINFHSLNVLIYNFYTI